VTAALECLADALDPAEYATTLTTRPGHSACLSVTSRHAQIGDDIWADNRAYYYSWGEWIAPISDPATAARMISVVLRGRSYAMCSECWQAAREVAQARRPALLITGTTTSAGK
jgi:hypothetical protein